MSRIGLPKGMSRDDAYVTGMADGIDEMRKVLEEYGDHAYGCRWDDKRYGCTCGWDEVSKNYDLFSEEAS